MPNLAPDGPLDTEQKGPLSFIGDPLGQVLKYMLKPIGFVTGAIGNPNGQAFLDVQEQVKNDVAYEKMDESDKKPDSERSGGARIGGNTQSGQNPLGL